MLNADKPEGRKSVQFDDEVKVKVFESETAKIDENKIDRLLYLLQDADPTGEKTDSQELLQLEEQCIKMSPLIDQELEKIDKQHAGLTSLNKELVDALNLYSNLMKESAMAQPGYAFGPVPPYPQQHQQQQQQPQNFYPGYQIPDQGFQMQPPPQPQPQYNPAYAYAGHYDTSGQYQTDQNGAVVYPPPEQQNNYVAQQPSMHQQIPQQPYYSQPTQNPPTM